MHLDIDGKRQTLWARAALRTRRRGDRRGVPAASARGGRRGVRECRRLTHRPADRAGMGEKRYCPRQLGFYLNRSIELSQDPWSAGALVSRRERSPSLQKGELWRPKPKKGSPEERLLKRAGVGAAALYVAPALTSSASAKIHWCGDSGGTYCQPACADLRACKPDDTPAAAASRRSTPAGASAATSTPVGVSATTCRTALRTPTVPTASPASRVVATGLRNAAQVHAALRRSPPRPLGRQGIGSTGSAGHK